ncbi:MAG: NADAR family protein [Gemmatimonadaceae bacterium]
MGAPLRAVAGTVFTNSDGTSSNVLRQALECGHILPVATDSFGRPRFPDRRRCIDCESGRPPVLALDIVSPIPPAAEPIQVIRFYRASERPYGVFSNLHRRTVVFDGREFPTAEHAYQFGKPRKPAVRDWLMSAPAPSLLAMAAHGLYAWDIAPGWSRGKVDRMRRVLHAKFSQHTDLAKLLVGTRTARLVETATVDSAVNRFWGEVNGIGRNTLGTLLMEIREILMTTRRTTEDGS